MRQGQATLIPVGQPAPSAVEHEPVVTVDDLVGYFSGAARPRSDWLIGVEHEKLPVTADGDPIPYGGPNSVVALLRGLERRGFSLTRDDGWVIGAERAGEAVSLEPGLQVELSAPPLETAAACRTLMRRHLRELNAVAGPLNVRFVAGGFQPFGTLDRIPWLPKRRYEIMKSYLPRHGRLGHDMMKRTATVQVNLDFDSEHNAVEKIRTAMAVTSIVTAIYAASPISEGRPNGYQSVRAAVWLDMDETRCGILTAAFEPGFGFRSYAEWALDVPMFFLYRDGRYRPLEGTTFRRFLREGIAGERATMEDWALHLSTLFPEVRLKRTIELRGADAGPAPFVEGLAALWRGLLDDDEACRAAYALVSDCSMADRMQLRRQVPRLGMAATLAGHRVADLALELCGIAAAGLARLPGGAEDARLLAPLAAAARAGRSPADQMLAEFQAVNGHAQRLVAAWELPWGQG